MESDRIDDLRRRNARSLVFDSGGPAEFARRIHRSPGQVNQFLGPNPTKNIGKKIARLIEAQYGKPEGWLDQDHDGFFDPSKSRNEIAERHFAETTPEQAVLIIKDLMEHLPASQRLAILRHAAAGLEDEI